MQRLSQPARIPVAVCSVQSGGVTSFLGIATCHARRRETRSRIHVLLAEKEPIKHDQSCQPSRRHVALLTAVQVNSK